MNLTTHIILRSQTSLLSQTLDSLISLKSKILVANLGTDQAALNVCKSYHADVKKYSWHKNMAEVRNRMTEDSTTEWNLYLEPWEALMDPEGVHAVLDEPKAYRLCVLTGESIRKEVRLWHKSLKCRFVNPVFETLDATHVSHCQAVIFENKVDRTQETQELLGEWEKNAPFSQDMRYFKALQSLTAGDYQTFVRMAQQHLFHEQKHPVAFSMLRYYLGLVNCIQKDIGEATRNAVACIAANPLMAEFWCLLGDIFFQVKDPGRAEIFYSNAKLLGGRRLSEDAWPMHIPKYDEYPTMMLEKCWDLRRSR